MCDGPDNQEVGLAAATLERVRNSSLVEWSRADNVSGLKPGAEAAGGVLVQRFAVGERDMRGEVVLEGTVECIPVRMPA